MTEFHAGQFDIAVIGAGHAGIEAALELGLKTVKFFPAEQSGGIEMIKAMSAPYGGVTFMPTGGVNPKNVNDYLAFSKINGIDGGAGKFWAVQSQQAAG